MELDVAKLDNKTRYKLLIGSVVPRPIAFVSTISPDGKTNLAPFSFFTGVCTSPMTVCFCPTFRGPSGAKKDTLRNLEATGEFVINVVTEDIARQMNVCSADFPYGVSEFDQSGLTPEPSRKVRPPRVRESPIHMECRLHQVVAIGRGEGGGNIVVGEVVHYHVRDDLYDPAGRIDIRGLKPVGRLAGAGYCRVNDLFDMPRPALKE